MGDTLANTWDASWNDAQTGKPMLGRGTEIWVVRDGRIAVWDATFNVWEKGGPPRRRWYKTKPHRCHLSRKRATWLSWCCQADSQPAAYAQPSSRIAQPAFHIFVMWRIFSPSNSMT